MIEIFGFPRRPTLIYNIYNLKFVVVCVIFKFVLSINENLDTISDFLNFKWSLIRIIYRTVDHPAYVTLSKYNRLFWKWTGVVFSNFPGRKVGYWKLVKISETTERACCRGLIGALFAVLGNVTFLTTSWLLFKQSEDFFF